MDAEGEGFAKQLAEIFKSAGWSCYCASPRASRSRAFPSARYKRSGLTTDLIVNHTIKSGAVLVRLNNPDTGPNGADANAQCQPSGLLLADKQASVADIDELSKDGGLRSDRADSEVPFPGALAAGRKHPRALGLIPVSRSATEKKGSLTGAAREPAGKVSRCRSLPSPPTDLRSMPTKANCSFSLFWVLLPKTFC